MMKFSYLTALIFLLPCSALAAAPTPYQASPVASQILISLSKEAINLRSSLMAIADNTADPLHAALIAGTINFNVVPDGTVYPAIIKINLSAAGAHTVDTSGTGTNPNMLGTLIPRIATETYPWPTSGSSTDKTAGDWMITPAVKNLVGNPAIAADGSCVMTAISAYSGDVVSSLFSYCDAEMATQNKSFWFEVLPVHLHCQMVSSPNLYNLRGVLRQIGICPANNVVMSQTNWEKYRAELMAEVLTGAIIWEAEKVIDSDTATFMKNKVRCFPAPVAPAPLPVMNEKVIASMAVPFDSSTTQVRMTEMGAMAMPEPNYAFGAATAYYTNPENSVFNNTYHEPAARAATSTAPYQFPSLTLTSTTASSYTYKEGGSLYFNFQIRGLQQPSSPSTCPSFCKNDSPLRNRAPASLPSVFDYYFRVPPLRNKDS